MDLQTSHLFFVIFLSCGFGIQLDRDGGYKGVLIAINPSVPEDKFPLQKIEDMIKDASGYLFRAVGDRFFFKEVTILVPSNWPAKKAYARATTERYDKANVIIDEPNEAYGDEPYTLQYGQCGEQGRYIHLTPNFMLDDTLSKIYGTRDRVFVHEWAHLRWGVYDEYNEEQPYYRTSDGRIEGTRCSKEIKGDYCIRSGNTCKPCHPQQSLPNSGCIFVPSASTTAKQSIMAFPSISSVTEFCSTETHNAEAPNRQNLMCGNRAVMDVILNSSVDARASVSSPRSNIFPNVKFVQRKTRVVCLTLDVSGSMGTNNRILRLQQAATLFLREIIEDTALVGIVQFSSDSSTLVNLRKITGKKSREDLISVLPTRPGGGTYICKGLDKTLEVLKQDDSSAQGDEIVLLTDGEASDKDILKNCLDTVANNGVIVHIIALGPDADKTLNIVANKTGGNFFYAADSVDSNKLIDAFASLTTSDGNLAHQAIQLESSGTTTTDWFNGTFSVDWTVGANTSITIIYQASPPTILIRSPKGHIFDQSNFQTGTGGRSSYLEIPGKAENGEWHYSLLNTGGTTQAMAITVTTRAASPDVAPIIVKAHMSHNSADGSKPLVVYAAVSQNKLPVIQANVAATLESDKGHVQTLQLLDNGAGADAFRHDGIYSRYFTNMKSGRYNLKVRVQNQDQARISPHRHSGAPYIPGYVVNGQVQLNPPKPPVNRQPVEVGSFSRTATGESFVVDLPSGYTPAFPPCKITDLKASVEGDNVTLTWTAPGESYDQGTASLYHIHWSDDFGLLRGDFDQAHVVNTSSLFPQEAGSIEKHSFIQSNFNISNGSSVFFAITTENAKLLRSEMSNIVHVVKFEPSEPQHHTKVLVVAASGTAAVLVVITALLL